MRISSKLPWVTSLLTATTLATDGRIYISGYPPGAFGQTLSPATTRLLLARRLGLSHFHSLEGADDTTLSILNAFGGEPTPLLHERRGGMLDQQTHLVIVEGVQNAEGEPTPTPKHSSLLISMLRHDPTLHPQSRLHIIRSSTLLLYVTTCQGFFQTSSTHATRWTIALQQCSAKRPWHQWRYILSS